MSAYWTDKQLVDAFEVSIGMEHVLDKVRGDETAKRIEYLRASILARMSYGWQLIPEGHERSQLGNVLIAAMYPDGCTMSDVYHDWWTFGGWARWPHPFPPTHYMIIQALPAADKVPT